MRFVKSKRDAKRPSIAIVLGYRYIVSWLSENKLTVYHIAVKYSTIVRAEYSCRYMRTVHILRPVS
jgi:hypothetical protein